MISISLPDCNNVRLLCNTLTLLRLLVISVTIHHSYKNTHTPTHQIMQPKKCICENQAQANLTITLTIYRPDGEKKNTNSSGALGKSLRAFNQSSLDLKSILSGTVPLTLVE